MYSELDMDLLFSIIWAARRQSKRQEMIIFTLEGIIQILCHTSPALIILSYLDSRSATFEIIWVLVDFITIFNPLNMIQIMN